MRRRLGANTTPAVPTSRFTAEILEGLRADFAAGRNRKLDKVVISDDVQPGLRAIVRRTGTISFHAHYRLPNGDRPYVVVGHWPDTSIEDARELTRIVRGLADIGVDVTEGLHARLIRELKRDGLRWRP